MQASTAKHQQDFFQSQKEKPYRRAVHYSKNKLSPSRDERPLRRTYKKDQLLSVFKICTDEEKKNSQSSLFITKGFRDFLNDQSSEPESFSEEPPDMKYCQAQETRPYQPRGGNFQRTQNNNHPRKHSGHRNKSNYEGSHGQQKNFQNNSGNNFRKKDQNQPGQDGEFKEEGFRQFRQKEFIRGEDALWDDDFTKKKFELGRVIERDDASTAQKQMGQLQLSQAKNQTLSRARVIKTTNIDCFLKAEEPLLLDEDHVLQDEEEDDPEWDDVNVEVLKSESKPLLQQLTSDQDTQKNNNNIKAPQVNSNKDSSDFIHNQLTQQWAQSSNDQLDIANQDEAIMTLNQSESLPLSQPKQQVPPIAQQPVATQEQQQQFFQDLYSKLMPAQSPNQQQISQQQLGIQALGSPLMTNSFVQDNQQFVYQPPQPFYQSQQVNQNLLGQNPYLQQQTQMNYNMNDLQTPSFRNSQQLQQNSQTELNWMYQQQQRQSPPATIQLADSPDSSSKSQNPFSLNSSVLMSKSHQDSKWFYKDPQGQIRGPFMQSQMSSWYDLGYFPDELEIAYGENSMFLPLRNYKEINISKQIMQGGGCSTPNTTQASHQYPQFSGFQLQHISPQIGSHQMPYQDLTQLGMMQQNMYDPTVYNRMQQPHQTQFYRQSPQSTMGVYMPPTQAKFNQNQQYYYNT